MEVRGSSRPPRLLLPLLLLLANYAQNVHAQTGGCIMHSQSGELLETEWSTVGVGMVLNEGKHKVDPLLDTAENDFPYYTFTNVQNVDMVNLNNQYFDAEFNEGARTVVIKTGKNFVGSERNWSNKVFVFSLSIWCGGQTQSSPLMVTLTVKDTNNHHPELSESGYEFKFPVPLTVGTELTANLPVGGYDYDVSGIRGDAKVEALPGATGDEAKAPEWFAASISSWNTPSRDFQVSLRTIQEVRTTEPVSFLLRVTDHGTNDEPEIWNSKTVTITFVPDVDVSVFSPRFKEPLYTAKFEKAKDVVEGAPLLAAPITFEEGHATHASILDGGSHSGAPADQFVDAKVSADGNSVQLNWKEDLDADNLESFLNQPYALLILTAEATGASQMGRTVVHLALPGAFVEPPEPCEVCTTTTSEPCPTTEEPTVCPETPGPCEECPTTSEPCPSTEEPTVCPETPGPCEECPTTSESCPTTEEPTVCPETPSTCEPCPSTEEPTVCPETPGTCEPCPSTEEPTVCPGTPDPCEQCPSTCEPCPSTEEPTVCPETPGPCEECPTTCGPCPSTEEPTVCPETPGPCEECPTTCPTTSEPCPTTCPTTSEPCPTTEEPTACPETPGPCEECPTTCGPCPSTEEPTVCPETPGPCEECPTTCGPSPSTEVPPTPTLQLEFEEELYVAVLPSTAQEGDPVAQPQLKNRDAVDEVVFSFEKGSSPTQLLIDSTSGNVTLGLDSPLTGAYEYTVLAEADGASPARTQLLVRGPLVGECGVGSACFQMALDVQKAKESEESQILSLPDSLSGVCKDCHFSILEGGEYFTVNKTTDSVVLNPVDREAEAFGGAEEPVLRLLLRIVRDANAGADADADANANADANALRNATRARADGDRDIGDWAKAAEKTTNDPSTMVLLVVVTDVNDNAPVFSPADVVVGFPSAEISAQLRPPALYTAKATDLDIGINAELHYSLAEQDDGAPFVTVHKQTGAVYPRAGANGVPADGATLRVHATDYNGQPGDPGTNTGDLTITLRLLKEEHLVDLRVQGALPEQADELLAQASSDDRELRLLTATVIPAKAEDKMAEGEAKSERMMHLMRVSRSVALQDDHDHDSSEEGDNAETDLRLVLYSLRRDQLEAAADFTEVLKDALKEAGYDAEADQVDLSGGGGNTGGGGGGGGGSDTGLLVAVIVLAVLLALALVAAGVVGYMFGVRPRSAKRNAQTLVEDPRSSSLDSVVEGFQPLSGEMLKKKPIYDEPNAASSISSEGTNAKAAEAHASNTGLWLAGPGGGGGAVETEGEEASDDYTPMAPEQHYEALPGSTHSEVASVDGSVDSQGRKSVFFNETVDCIEIRM